MTVEIRRTLTQIQDTHVEGGFTLDKPTKLVTAIAIIKNPWFGRGYVEDLQPEIREHGPVLGKLLTVMLLDVCGDKLEGCGKASTWFRKAVSVGNRAASVRNPPPSLR